MKSKSEITLAIAKLVLTAIVGIVIALYLQYRDEALQRTTVNLQAQHEKELLALQMESNLAHLEIDHADFQYSACSGGSGVDAHCGGGFEIRNPGPIKAIDISIALQASQVSSSWLSRLHDVSAFQVATVPSSVECEIENTRVEIWPSGHGLSGNNTFRIRIASLPPRASIAFVLWLRPSEPAMTYGYSRAAIISLEQDQIGDEGLKIPSQSVWETLLPQYLASEFHVATFEAIGTCGNCEGVMALGEIRVPSLRSWKYNHLESKVEGSIEWWTAEIDLLRDAPDDIFRLEDDPIELLLRGPDDVGKFKLIPGRILPPRSME